MSNLTSSISRDQILDKALTRVGSDWILDGIYLFAFPILGLISFLLNIISYAVFTSPQFSQKPLYIYIRMSCLNSALINFISAINFLWTSRRYLAIANTHLAIIMRCFFRYPVVLSAYSFGSFLDIILALERLCELTNSKNLFHRFRPYLVCLLLLLLAISINITIIFMAEPKKQVLKIDAAANLTLDFFYLGKTSFSITKFGVLTRYIRFFVRDILTLFLLFAINLAAFINFRKKYYNSSSSSLLPSSSSSSEVKSASAAGENRRQTSPWSSDKSNKPFLPMITRVRFSAEIMKANKMLTKMVFIICAFSTFEHLFLILGVQIFELEPRYRLIKIIVNLATNTAMLLKNSINFFIFYNYNSRFRIRFKNSLFSVLRWLRLK